jgi:hypothetical protein
VNSEVGLPDSFYFTGEIQGNSSPICILFVIKTGKSIGKMAFYRVFRLPSLPRNKTLREIL